MSNFGINLHYITVATKQHPVLDKIIERVKKQNEQMIILGLKENRKIGWEGTGNFGVKLRETRDFIFNDNIRPQDIVLFTDAYDVIYGGSQIEVLKRFIQQKKPIMFGSESQCHPDKEESSKYTEKTTEFPYLNSGMFIGYVWALRFCLLDYEYNDADDDQRYWTKQYLQYPWLFNLDYENQLFLNTEDMDWDKFTWENATATYKNNNPQFVHVNGPDKGKLERFV